MEMASYNVQSFMTGFFDLAYCFQGSSIIYQYFIPLYSQVLFCCMDVLHFIYQLMDILIVYTLDYE